MLQPPLIVYLHISNHTQSHIMVSATYDNVFTLPPIDNFFLDTTRLRHVLHITAVVAEVVVLEGKKQTVEGKEIKLPNSKIRFNCSEEFS